MFLSVLTLGEIRKSVEGVRPRDPAKAGALKAWLAEVVEAFGPLVLGVDLPVAEAWSRMPAARSAPMVDALLAATASVHGLVLVTRNVTGVEASGARVLDPFAAARK